MNNASPPEQPPSIFQRMRKTLAPKGIPTDRRGRIRMVLDSLILHIHPTKVNARSLKFSYTWGLGGLSALLTVVLVITGILLEMNYTPRPPQAYLDIINLNTNVWFGGLIRNLHHWSGNLLIIAAVLHLLRVFFTGGHRPPRELNWLIGVAMLLLVLGANFTGYLLPWDQLAYWAITVGTSIINYIPIFGPSLSRLLLGGPEVGAATLLNFYALHISIIPVSVVLLMAYHFWRVRKDGGLTVPKKPGEELPKRLKSVTTVPNLVRPEMVFALIWVAILLAWAMLVPAPLEGIANPLVSPNPAKAPWYFMGLQELLLHFHPVVGAVVIPGLALTALALLPFYDVSVQNVGVFFRSIRGRYLAQLATGFALLATPAWVLGDEFIVQWTVWLPNWPTWLSNGLIPLSVIGAGIFLLDKFITRLVKANLEERVLFLFIFLFTAFIILTIVGIFFRGTGMELFWPWAMPAH